MKNTYETPTIKAIELAAEAPVCMSGNHGNHYGWGNGNGHNNGNGYGHGGWDDEDEEYL